MDRGNIIIHAVLRANAEQRHSLVDLLVQTQRACQSEPGCVAYRMAQDLVSEDMFHVFEIWDGDTAFLAHKAGRPFGDFLTGLSACGRLVESTRWVGPLSPYALQSAAQVSA